MTLQTTLTSSYNIAGLNLKQKVYICLCAHIDINEIYKSKKADQLLL